MEKAKMQKTKCKVCGIGVSWKLFAFLIGFVAFMMLVVWVFQVFLLESLYKSTKRNELESISLAIGEYVGTESLGDAVYSCAVDYSTCIRVFKFSDSNSATEVASADVSTECSIHNIPHQMLNRTLNGYYSKALDNGGVFAETSEMSSKLGTFWSDSDGEEPLFDFINSTPNSLVMVYNRVIEGADGETYMVLLNSELTPVDATVNTLKMQFYWIAFVMVIGALVLAFLISKNISSPIKKMNESAKKLAEGRYDADFSVSGYREIIELSESLEDAADKLSKLDSLQRELVANVSHDLRTPLTLIKGYGEVMRDIPDENTPENLQVIVDEANHLGELVNDLLDLSRIRSGARVPEFSEFDLTAAVREVMTRYDKLVKAGGYKIEFTAENDSYICADRMMIIQVVYNLINNAINYAGEDKTVHVTQTGGDGKVRISVSDNGEGIPPDQIDSIWDRYYKVDRVHKRAKVGTGLGLSIVKGTLELHKATYGVESALGHGSRFWFELPTIDMTDDDEEIVQ
mgnify:CR=1 FL=1